LGKASDERSGAPIGPATQLDLVPDLAVTYDQDAIGLRGSSCVVGDQDDRLAQLVA
jgi:hypothetical protein